MGKVFSATYRQDALKRNSTYRPEKHMTAAFLRWAGEKIPAEIPDDAWLPMSSMPRLTADGSLSIGSFVKPFEWRFPDAKGGA